jgi:hypothetical protein
VLDGYGNEQWFQAHDSGYADEPQGADVLSDDGIVVVGGQVIGKNGEELGQLWRLDRWGHKACDAPGSCAAHTWKACDDGKVCTADGCHPKLGCTASPINGLHCDPVNGCSKEALCASGTCEPSANGRMYTNVYNVYGPGDLAYDLRYSGGKIGYMARTSPDSTTAASSLFNDNFDNESNVYYTGCGDVTLYDLRRGKQDKSLWGLWGDATKSKSAKLCFKVDTTLQVIPLPICSGCSTTGIGLAITVDGGAWALTHQTLAAAHKAVLHRYDQNGAKGGDVVLPWCGDGVCGDGENAANCPADCASAKTGSCAKHCGGTDAANTCHCDTACVNFKDCCADYAAVCTATAALTPTSVAAMPDAVALVGSLNSSGAKEVAQLDKIDVTGKVVWSRTLTLNGDLRPLAVASNAKGWAAMAGRFEPNAAVHTPAYALLDATGKTVWLGAVDPPDMGEADAVLIESDGGLVMSGWRDDKGVKRPALWRVDAAGGVMWSRLVHSGTDLPLDPRPGQLVRADDGYLVAAASKVSSWAVLAMIRTDLNGFASCVDAGKCAANKADACDDGKPCTADSCDPIGGCVHTPIAALGCSNP